VLFKNILQVIDEIVTTELVFIGYKYADASIALSDVVLQDSIFMGLLQSYACTAIFYCVFRKKTVIGIAQ